MSSYPKFIYQQNQAARLIFKHPISEDFGEMIPSIVCRSQGADISTFLPRLLLPQPLQKSRHAGSCLGFHEVSNNGYEFGHGFGVHSKV